MVESQASSLQGPATVSELTDQGAPGDAVVSGGAAMGSSMHAHLTPEQRHTGGRQVSVSGWSPKSINEPGSDLRSPKRENDVVTQIPAEMHARLGGVYAMGKGTSQDSISGWSRKYIEHGRSPEAKDRDITGDSHIRTYYNEPNPGAEDCGPTRFSHSFCVFSSLSLSLSLCLSLSTT